MDIKKIAQDLVNELEAGAARQKFQAEGVAMLFNKLVEVSQAEQAEQQAGAPSATETAPKNEQAQ